MHILHCLLVKGKTAHCLLALLVYRDVSLHILSAWKEPTEHRNVECGTSVVCSFNHLQWNRKPQDIKVTPTIFTPTKSQQLIPLSCSDLVEISFSHANSQEPSHVDDVDDVSKQAKGDFVCVLSVFWMNYTQKQV